MKSSLFTIVMGVFVLTLSLHTCILAQDIPAFAELNLLSNEVTEKAELPQSQATKDKLTLLISCKYANSLDQHEIVGQIVSDEKLSSRIEKVEYRECSKAERPYPTRGESSNGSSGFRVQFHSYVRTEVEAHVYLKPRFLGSFRKPTIIILRASVPNPRENSNQSQKDVDFTVSYSKTDREWLEKFHIRVYGCEDTLSHIQSIEYTLPSSFQKARRVTNKTDHFAISDDMYRYGLSGEAISFEVKAAILWDDGTVSDGYTITIAPMN